MEDRRTDKTTFEPATPPIKPTSERIKEEFSLVQVIASALSAVTGVILAPKIGVVGGILGVGIGAAVAAIVSQVYKSVLNASAEKLKYNLGSDLDSPVVDDIPAVDTADMQTRVINSPSRQGVHAYKKAATGTPIAPVEFRLAAKEEKRLAVRRLLVVVAITLAAVAASAGIITAVTNGEGIGRKPDPIIIYKEVQTPTPKPESPTSPNDNKTAPIPDTKPEGNNEAVDENKDTEENKKPQTPGQETPDTNSDSSSSNTNANTSNDASDNSSNTTSDNSSNATSNDQSNKPPIQTKMAVKQ